MGPNILTTLKRGCDSSLILASGITQGLEGSDQRPVGDLAALPCQSRFAEIAVRPSKPDSVATEARGIVSGLLTEPEQIASVADQFFWDLGVGRSRRCAVQYAFHLIDAADQAPVQPVMPVKVMHTLGQVAAMPAGVHNPHDGAGDCAAKRNAAQNGRHEAPWLSSRTDSLIGLRQ